jgi:amidohydrolase
LDMSRSNKQQVYNHISRIAPRIQEIARQIGNRPELGHQEFFASQLLIDELTAAGFSIIRNVLDLPTAFIAEYKSTKSGPIIAYLCEYDALPGVGHACGHHLICTMSMAAAIGLKSVIDSIGGTIRVYGTPAEETSGAKVPMAAAGLFDDVDIALMAHPYSRYEASGASLAMDAIQYEYVGKPAHAAASPHEGINALDAVLMLFNATNALRQQIRSDARIHGIITDGGKAPNIIPDFACAKFYIRSADRSYTNELTFRMQACAEGAAMQTGCTLSVIPYEYSYDELRTNEALSSVFNQNLTELGVAEQEIEHGKDNGSVDLGNVSLRCPAIHPYVKVMDENHQLHTTEFRDLAMTDRAMELMLIGAQTLAGTGYDICSHPHLLAGIQHEFQQLQNSQKL